MPDRTPRPSWAHLEEPGHPQSLQMHAPPKSKVQGTSDDTHDVFSFLSQQRLQGNSYWLLGNGWLTRKLSPACSKGV